MPHPLESSGVSPARFIDLLLPDDAPALAPAASAIAPRMLWASFVEIARAHPERPAIIGTPHTISYDLLLESALRLAQMLINLGVNQEAPVAICMRKNWPQVAAAIGVQLAGAAYLPVPTDWPNLRIATLIENTGARVAVIDGDDMRASLPSQVTLLPFDAQGPIADLEDLIRDRDPRDLAYIIPTSGTTGQPKAVMVEHGAAWNTVHAINEMFGVGAHDRVLALSSLSFDLSVYDIFGPLAVGGAIVLPDAARLRDPEHWIERCRSAGVTIWNSVPALARLLVDGGLPRGQALTQCASVRLMMLSGDWIPVALAQRIREQRPDLALVSLGGATEASIWSISYPIEDVDPAWTSVPYGRALPGQTIAVLDESLERLPPWVEGEIHIGGVGLARGYWRDETLSRERFITHPRTGERLYRTGDLGRVTLDGTVEILGRMDSQVKISGHRVELGEIETHLQRCPGVRAAVVSYRPTGPLQRQQLVGYVVLADSEAPASSQPDEITDPIERLKFKLREPGVRQFPASRQPIALAHPADATLAAAFHARRTHRAFDAIAVTWDALTTLVWHVVQLKLEGFPLPKYLYPSAGSLYPVQTYLHVRPDRVEGLAAGSYYVDPRGRGLYPLAVGATLPVSCFGHVNLRAADQAAFSIVLVGELAAIAPMYPQQAKDFCLLEAGYMGQALMQAAADAGLGLCPIGGLEGNDWRTLFQLGPTQIFLHAFVGGVPVHDTRTVRMAGDLAGALAGLDGEAPADQAPPPRQTPGRAAALREVRTFLESRLPAHMIPSAWVVLDALPLTENGKIERKQLPEPIVDAEPEVADMTMTRTEAAIQGIWQALLGGKAIGLDLGFFDAGGDSMLLLDLQERLRQQLTVTVPLAHFFQYPTIRSLARWVDQEPRQERDDAGTPQH